LTDNANNFVLVDYNGGTPALTVTISPGTINTTTNSIAYLISRVGTTLDYINLVGQNVDANGKLRRRFLNSESLRRSQGAVLTASNRNLLLTAGLFYSGLIESSTPAFNTSTGSTFTQVYNNGTWIRTTGNTQINNTQYNLAGVLTTMPSNDYRVDYVYILADNPSKLYVLLGTATYNNISSARLAPVPADLPTELQYLGSRLGRVIIQKDATITETTSEFATIYQAGSATLHNDLGGLNLGDFQHLTVAEKANNELKTNKQNSLTTDGTGVKYPTIDAINNSGIVPLLEKGTVLSGNFISADYVLGANTSISSNNLNLPLGGLNDYTTTDNRAYNSLYGSTNINKWTANFSATVPTITGTSYGFSFGLNGSKSAYFRFCTDTSKKGKIEIYLNGVLYDTSFGTLPISSSDNTEVTIRREVNSFVISWKNITTSRQFDLYLFLKKLLVLLVFL